MLWSMSQSGVPALASPLEVYPHAINSPDTLWYLIYGSQTYATVTSNGLTSSIGLLNIECPAIDRIMV